MRSLFGIIAAILALFGLGKWRGAMKSKSEDRRRLRKEAADAETRKALHKAFDDQIEADEERVEAIDRELAKIDDEPVPVEGDEDLLRRFKKRGY